MPHLRCSWQIMDSSFTQNQVLPDDPSYKYDTRVDFEEGSVEAAGWDSSEDFWD